MGVSLSERERQEKLFQAANNQKEAKEKSQEASPGQKPTLRPGSESCFSLSVSHRGQFTREVSFKYGWETTDGVDRDLERPSEVMREPGSLTLALL